MSLWSLTREKVKSLLKSKADKEAELQILLDTTLSQMWTKELDEFLELFSDHIEALRDQDSKQVTKIVKSTRRGKAGKAVAKKKPKKKAVIAFDEKAGILVEPPAEIYKKTPVCMYFSLSIYIYI